MAKCYKTISKISGSFITVDGVEEVRYGEFGHIELEDKGIVRFQVIEVDKKHAVLQVYDDNIGINPSSSKVFFSGKKPTLGVSDDLFSRIFDGLGRPIDGAPELLADMYVNVEGLPVNPLSREMPADRLVTGISGIDDVCPIAKGQKMAIISEPGVPHLSLAAQIAESTNMSVVFAALGSASEEIDLFVENMKKSGAIDRSVSFISFAGHSPLECLEAPKFAMTAAEYIAFEKNMDVLVIMTDLASYADAFRESEPLQHESLYSNLASIFERSGKRKDRVGTITVLPMLTASSDEASKEAALTLSRITEGRIILSRDLYRRGVIPPIDPVLSFSQFADPELK
ncbi:MAG: V-type ATP synthase subunit B [Lachnospiraceae bacterium]|nr:V-type ATP synthase subunit B [Lachnospiraceae bacterium]